MLLKSLELAGFKSFARPTCLEFPTGLTALVGPNGSGKSNLVDAVRWCLGEQSMRDLRGQRSEDVIYAGPRRVLGAAEVALTFETAAGEEGATGLSVARRLYRSGDSEYLVNRRKARLRDLSMALRDLGIDNARHVVVSQGMADAWLAATPGERRALLEAAAGLAGYRERRNEARDKLTTASRNMETIEVVLAELEPRVKLLRRQARAVQERDTAVETLRLRLIDWYAHRWQQILLEVTSARDRLDVLARRREECLEALRERESRAEAALQAERDWHHRAEAAAAALHLMERERDALEHRLAQAVHRRAAAERSLAEASARRGRLVASLEELRRRAESGAGEREAMLSSSAALRGRRGALDSQRASLQQEWEERRRRAEEARAALREIDEERTGLEATRTSLARSVEDRTRRREALNRWIGECEEELGTLRSRSVERAGHASALEAGAAALQGLLEALQARAGAQEAWELRLEMFRRRLLSQRAQLESSLSASRLTVGKLEDRVADTLVTVLRVSAGWERAVATALGPWAGVHLHADSPSPNLGEATRDFLNWRETLPIPSWARWADELVFGPCLGPLPATLFVESAEEGRHLWHALSSLPGHRIGSPSVQVVDRSGRCWTGAGVREAAREEPAEAYLRAKHEAETAERKLSLCSQRLKRVEAAAGEARRELERLHTEQGETRSRLGTVTAERDRLTAEIEAVQRRLNHLTGERSTRADQLAALDAELAQGRGGLSTCELALEERAAAHAEATAAVETAAVAERGAAAQLETVRQELRQVDADLAVLEATCRRHEELSSASQQDLERLGEEIEQQDGLLSEQAEQIATAALEIDELTLQRTELDPRLDEQRVRVGALQKQRPRPVGESLEVGRLRETMSGAIAAHERKLAEVEHLEGARASLAVEISRELGLTPEALAQSGEAPPSDDEIKRLRTRAAQGADLELSVVDEWRELDERQRYLQLHLQDLRAAGEALQETIRITDREMHGRFETAFAAVSEEFAGVFQVMLRGGRAWLEQQADGGIEIHAELPGRRSRASAAFSGGERSLVASSLLFGLLRIRPAPFCILDEVDAALDESNVDRYLSVLRDVSRRTQTIVVTHNRATMAAADVLYGVTMDDEGVSRVLSLRLDAYEAAV